MSERTIFQIKILPSDLCPPNNPIGTTGHHWIIETPREPISKGHCLRCKEERGFWNSQESYMWEDPQSGRAWRTFRNDGRKTVVDQDVDGGDFSD